MLEETSRHRLKVVKLKDGNTILIKPLGVGDIGNLCSMLWSLSDRTRKFYHPPFEVYDFKSFIKTYLKFVIRVLFNKLTYKLLKRYFLGIIGLNDHKEVVGFVHLSMKAHGLFKHTNYGIVIRDDYQSKGLGKALTRCIIKSARELKLSKITLGVITSNKKAIELYKKFGFVIEDVHKQKDVWRNNVFDVYYMTLYLH